MFRDDHTVHIVEGMENSEGVRRFETRVREVIMRES